MSYRIRFKVKAEGVNAYLEVGCCDANITWNVRRIIELSTGLPWKNEANNGLCVDVIPKIWEGRDKLVANPEEYLQYEDPDGWGTVKGTINFFENICQGWDEFRRDFEELVPVATFWIV